MNPGGGAAPGWTAGASIWSGRPDPAWAVSAPDAKAVLAIWGALPTIEDVALAPTRLGYRGCWLRAPDGRRWTAEIDKVVMTEDAGSGLTHARRDAAGAFERLILATAPAGLLPANLAGPR